MRMRLVSLATVILRKTVTQLIRAIPNCAAGGRCGIWFTAGNEGGKRQAHTPEERGPRCRRRAQSPAPCAIVESCTRCTCAEEPLVYSRDKGIAQVALNWVKLTLTVSSGRDAAYGRCATQRRKCFCFDHLFLSTSAFAVFFGIERTVFVPGACSDEISASFSRRFGVSDWIRACVRSPLHVPLQHLFHGLD